MSRFTTTNSVMPSGQLDDKENPGTLNNFDFTAIEEMDPSLGKNIVFIVFKLMIIAEGHRIIYDREVPFELRIHDSDNGPQEVGTLEAIRVKFLILVWIDMILMSG